MRSNWWRTLSFMLVAVAIVVLANSYAEAQCAMCRAALTSATDSRFIHNFNIGVLVLLVPPATIFCSIFIVLRKYGPRMNADDTDQEKD
jgi:heme/copper-type cytochrome/quinol oxidase subunit 2